MFRDVLVQDSARNPHDSGDVDLENNTFETLTLNLTQNIKNKLINTEDIKNKLIYEINKDCIPLGCKNARLNGIKPEESVEYLKNPHEEIYFERCVNCLKLLKAEEKNGELTRNTVEQCNNSTNSVENNQTVDSLGPDFWSDYHKSLKNSINQQKLQLGDLISECCYKVDTKTLCAKCKYNHIKHCIDLSNCENTEETDENCLDITVSHAKSRKVIDSFTVNLTPETNNKSITKFVNNIKISVQSNLDGTMNYYNLTNTPNTPSNHRVNSVQSDEFEGPEGLEIGSTNSYSMNNTSNFNLNNYYTDDQDTESTPETTPDPQDTELPEVDTEVCRLIDLGIKLHAFKINNRGVNLPLFLNIGNPESIYSGQGFVTGDSIGLFKIAVVEAFEPKKSLLDTVRNAIPFDLSHSNCPCKCSNHNSCKPFTTATIIHHYNTDHSSNGLNKVNEDGMGIFNSILKSIVRFTGFPLLNPGTSNTTPVPNMTYVRENVCLFHRNLLTEVDRKRFGKDIYCRMKYFGSVSADKPVRVLDHSPAGSRVSSFFNGYYQQLLCVSGEDKPEDCDHLKHKYTFIIRCLKGKRYGRNFTILNTTSGEHLCLDLLTHELRFAREDKFSKHFVPAIFKILPLKTVVAGVITDAFNCYYTYYRVVSPAGKGFVTDKVADEVVEREVKFDEECESEVKREPLCPNSMSTTDQYINISA
ncbi:hypothetical protein TpMuguga_04g00405 [Theileria parva strain Muguga]|uniref:uncharacterized protein n=1 Tax=Theileria parva strain Muguga TaxID=333668 RepID=UPI001C61D948|nr:uncharacterized protein TpMuguga_04g00405 [Theileria parva strain Muguga]EAN31757.2 hypothetical protein TpMuguga_04g00405 [Theileria parva strain Muguga]